jgi:hypothetical protein
METDQKSAASWRQTPYTNSVRYLPSGIYFARFKVQGKLIRKTLKPQN